VIPMTQMTTVMTTLIIPTIAALLTFLMLVAGGLAGCGSDAPGSAPAIGIRVERVPAERAFLVTYDLAVDARALVFKRDRVLFRAQSWTPKTGDQTLARWKGKEAIVSSQVTRRFEVLVPENFVEFGGDYPFMSEFSDGGIALFTGHLDVVPVACGSSCSDKELRAAVSEAANGPSPPVYLTLVPAPGQKVIAEGVPGQPLMSATSISLNPSSQGVIAYFGELEPVPRRGYSVITDPKLPSWIPPVLDRYLPLIVDLHKRKLGRGPAAPSLIFIPRPTSARRYSSTYSGAVVGNRMVLALFGSTWETDTPKVREEFLKLVAHETFHLWNASLYHSVDKPGGAWLHEGSADAFAYLALLELGVLRSERYVELQEEAINRCLVGLSGADLVPSDRSWPARSHYECGAVIEHLIHRRLRRGGADLWKLWSALFDVAARKDGFYTHDDFFAVAAQLTADAPVLAYVKKLVAGEARLESFFFAAYGSVGAVLVADDQKWPDWYHRLIGERALSAALESDCSAGEGYFMATPTGRVKLVGGPSCRNLKEEREIRAIGRHRLWDEGVQAYDLVRLTCMTQNSITISKPRRGKIVELLCPDLPERPRFVRFPVLQGLVD